MKFVAIYEQSGQGCDYSIDCGKTYYIFNAKNRKEARDYVYKDIFGEKLEDEDYVNYFGERYLDNVILAEVPEQLPIEKWYEKVGKELEKQEKEEKEEEEEEELKELERLKTKYGK